jgi:hypothetical protein
MTHPKLRIHNTPVDNLVSNLRGEVGEIISLWVLTNELRADAARFAKNVQDTFADPLLARLHIIIGHFEDEIIARLSELGEQKIGRLTFYFAAEKLKQLHSSAAQFSDFVRRNRFTEKRNYDISHKELPETFEEHKFILISRRIVLRAIALALRLMKKIDRASLGPSAPYFWRTMRARRRELTYPASTAYGLMPYMRLPDVDRIRVAVADIAEGLDTWSEMVTKVNGVPGVVRASKKWGVILLGRQFVVVAEYPLHELQSIDFVDDQPSETSLPEPAARKGD